MLADDDLIEYYKRELAYLRHQGADFSARYPKVASRLALGGAESPDPHTERLIEANAFLAARVHRDLDREFPQVAAALLESQCPSLMQPVPSISVAQLALDPTQGKVTAGYVVPRHTSLVARTASGETCRMRTAWDNVLWPLDITDVRLSGASTLCLQVSCSEGLTANELALDSLRLHLHGDWMSTMPLYDLLVSAVMGVDVVDAQGHVRHLPRTAWREVGYDLDQSVLPNPPHAAAAYGLLQEYFSFPGKFHFFDLTGLSGLTGHGEHFELRLQLDRSARGLRGLDAESFKLGCVPIVNLFNRTSEPMTIDHRHHEYLLVGDRQFESTTEVHSILSVVASDPDADRPQRITAFAALDSQDTSGASAGGQQDSAEARPEVFWSARRETSLRANLTGTDMFLSFVDPNNTRSVPSEPVVFAQLLCTNRRLASQLRPQTRLRAENLSSSLAITCLYEPSEQRDPPLSSATMWRLVGLLRLNHQSLVGGTNGVQTLRDMLSLFASSGARDLAQIKGVRTLQARGVTARLGSDAWRGFCRGTEVQLGFDETAFVGGSPLLLSAVLARFFALYTTVNSFVRLTARRNGEDWKRWEPMCGHQNLL
ncbi:type VI secretion system baseplate subunit TssF [Limnohabitans sp. Rim8]|jgi:type VI secretion system protein ImpG|uniref:type VI secretion system baseplate subunit TssF n=1 Tax=Limnohabitans sp. Rim8 TaxID=1100718 RepID=UPI0025DBD9BA|nr:type VI secretion system baseplate subunit TssF [Limnohabitans sp. Rim8]